MSEKAEASIWCVVGNIVDRRATGVGGSEIKSGTKHFPPGAKVYCCPPLWGDGYENIRVIGRHRGSHLYVTMVIKSDWVENWRVKLVYSPHVINELKKQMANWTKETAETMVQSIIEYRAAKVPNIVR
jgi:hypothetical protein